MTIITETYDTLDTKTVAELRAIVRSRGIVGFLKKNKDLTIKAILDDMGNTAIEATPAVVAPTKTMTKSHTEKLKATMPAAMPTPVTSAQFTMSSVLTKPSAKFGDKTTTTIQVSCGANSADFPVLGKSVGAVQEFLKEVLNIDRLAEGQVSGKSVKADYVLQEGDVLEFIKPAGRKG